MIGGRCRFLATRQLAKEVRPEALRFEMTVCEALSKSVLRVLATRELAKGVKTRSASLEMTG
jgi:hypothetical protein